MTTPAIPAAGRPVFIVGSPRSGTSILTWCLGQHSNILVQEESNWIGPFAFQVALHYQLGTIHGARSQLSALDIAFTDFSSAFGVTINDLILSHRGRFESKATEIYQARFTATTNLKRDEAFKLSRSKTEPKKRWIDGTPEYSFYICALRKLFPEAKFIHVVRDVASVVRSLMNFHRTGGPGLVANEEEAYDYWLRAVRACRQAEIAYGSDIVRRVTYSDLIAQPEKTLRDLLVFLNEPYEATCLEPLQSRINSSEVPDEFDPSDAKTSAEIVEEARELENELAAATPSIAPSPEMAEALEAAFQDRARYLAQIESDLANHIAYLEKEIASLKAHSRHAEGDS